MAYDHILFHVENFRPQPDFSDSPIANPPTTVILRIMNDIAQSKFE